MEDPHQILLVANRTCPCPGMLDYVAASAATHEACVVHIVAPALNSRLRHICSDVDGAIVAARARLEQALGHLRGAGISATGAVGDSDPLCAIGDALCDFAADEIVVSTFPPGRSNWLERRLIERARARYALPVTHLVSEYGLDSDRPLAA